MKIINFIKITTNRFTDAIGNFKDDPLSSSGIILPIIIEIMSFISCVIAYIMFVYDGAYVRQIETIKELGTDGITEALTSEAMHIITQGKISKI